MFDENTVAETSKLEYYDLGLAKVVKMLVETTEEQTKQSIIQELTLARIMRENFALKAENHRLQEEIDSVRVKIETLLLAP